MLLPAAPAGGTVKSPMRISGFIAISIFLGAWVPISLRAQERIPQQENPAPPGASPDLSGLQLTDVRRPELEDAFRRRDYKRAESILIDEAEKDPKSIRTSGLLVLAGGIFFLDGQYADSAIAWKKAEAIAPLDDRSRFTL